MIKKEEEEEEERALMEIKWSNHHTLTKGRWNQGQTLVNRSIMKLRSQETNKIFLVFLRIKIILELK